MMSFRGFESQNRKRSSGKKLGFNKHKIDKPQINNVPLSDMGLKSLQEFVDIDKDTPATPAGSVWSEGDEHVLGVDVAIAGFVCDYAVNAFNKTLEAYGKDKLKLSEVVLMRCGYYKRYKKEYWFTLELEAVEEGVCGINKSIVSCKTDGGVMKLCNFIRDGKSGNEKRRPISKEKTVKGGFDPADYYGYTGFVERRACGGYDYRNPGEVLFRLRCPR